LDCCEIKKNICDQRYLNDSKFDAAKPVHQTLNHDLLIDGLNHTRRRISSSGASKKFPRDFFKAEGLMPLRKSKSKCHPNNLMEEANVSIKRNSSLQGTK
jgi:hypothetical protein